MWSSVVIMGPGSRRPLYHSIQLAACAVLWHPQQAVGHCGAPPSPRVCGAALSRVMLWTAYTTRSAVRSAHAGPPVRTVCVAMQAREAGQGPVQSIHRAVRSWHSCKAARDMASCDGVKATQSPRPNTMFHSTGNASRSFDPPYCCKDEWAQGVTSVVWREEKWRGAHVGVNFAVSSTGDITVQEWDVSSYDGWVPPTDTYETTQRCDTYDDFGWLLWDMGMVAKGWDLNEFSISLIDLRPTDAAVYTDALKQWSTHTGQWPRKQVLEAHASYSGEEDPTVDVIRGIPQDICAAVHSAWVLEQTTKAFQRKKHGEGVPLYLSTEQTH